MAKGCEEIFAKRPQNSKFSDPIVNFYAKDKIKTKINKHYEDQTKKVCESQKSRL